MIEPCVMTIGNFDGVHCGHQRIVQRAVEIARQRDVVVKVVTFDPHPATVLRPEDVPPRLTLCEDKVRLLKQAGADEVVVLEPTAQCLGMSPDAFVQMLVRDHAPRVFVEGKDFRYGKNRQGNLDTLEAQGRSLGFSVETVEAVEAALSDHLIAPVRSSLIRWLIAHGRVADASICLGRLFSISGTVVKGEQRGQRIGVPTANVELAGELHIPGNAVYAGVAETSDGATHAAAISVGIKPTFKNSGQARTIEAHLLDFDGDVYGESLTLRFVRWLRDQQMFPGIDALKKQLARDIAQVRCFADDPNFDQPVTVPQPQLQSQAQPQTDVGGIA